MGDRTGYRAGRAAQLREQVCRVARVDRGVERVLQGFERLRMIFQVHLHAADVDILRAVGLELADRGDRGVLRRVKTPLSMGSNCPRSGKS